MERRKTVQAAEGFVREFHRRTKRPKAEAPDEEQLVEPPWVRAAFDETLASFAPPEEESLPLADAHEFLTLPTELPTGGSHAAGTAEAADAPAESAAVASREDPAPTETRNGTSNGSWGELDSRWAEMKRYFEAGATLRARVTGWNKGGLLVTVENLQGFVPASQLVRFPRYLDVAEREAYLADQKATELQVKVIELDQDRNRLVLSERACFWANQYGDSLLSTLKSGHIIEGIVSNLCDFGAFVDLGEIDGLIHISELSWRRINHPGEVLKVGDRVRVFVLEVNEEQKRIALSLKRLYPDPWQTAEERYQAGQTLRGTITNVVGFGAFARVEDGLEGLIHISELADGDFLHPRNVVQEGDEVTVRVLHVDAANRRLGLSLRRAAAPPASPEDQPGLVTDMKE